MKKNIRTEEILCAGFGGQGIMFLGKLLAYAGMNAGKHVTWMPSYGAEVRGGTAYSMIKISDKEIASPIVLNPTILIVMNKPSYQKYESKLKEGSILIANKSLIDNIVKRKNIKIVNVAMTDLAFRLGDKKVANMIALGALIKRINMIPMKNVMSALGEMLKGKEELLALNKKALEKGHSV